MGFRIDTVDLVPDDHRPRSKPLSRRGGDVYLVGHHSVSRTRGAIMATFKSRDREVTANLAIGPDVAGVDDYKTTMAVDIDTMRAYTTASWIDDLAVTFEMANLTLGGSYPVGSSGKRILVELIVWMHQTYGMPVDRWHVTCHREVYGRGWDSYPTACPGDDLHAYLDAAVAEAQQIIAGVPGPSRTDIDMRTVVWNGKHVFTFGPEQVKHETEYWYAVATARVLGQVGDVPFEKVDNGSMTAICESFGVPWYAVDAALNGKAFKIDGQPGGRFWSRQLEIQAAVKGLGGIDQSLVRKTIEQSLADGLKGVKVMSELSAADKTAIADAVNDEAGRRLGPKAG